MAKALKHNIGFYSQQSLFSRDVNNLHILFSWTDTNANFVSTYVQTHLLTLTSIQRHIGPTTSILEQSANVVLQSIPYISDITL